MTGKRARRIGLSLAAVLAVAALLEPVFGQSPAPAVNAPAPGAVARENVVREISDPSTGRRWLLKSDPDHPVGPGRLLLVEGPISPSENRSIAARANPMQREALAQLPVIHAGDRVVVEEHTTLLDSRFGARALGPALLGGEFRARLDIGGAIVRVVAGEAGRASFAIGEELR